MRAIAFRFSKEARTVSAAGPLLLLASLLRALSEHRASKLRLNLFLHRGLHGLNHKILKTQAAKCRICFGLPDKVFGKVSEIDCLCFHGVPNVSYDTVVVKRNFTCQTFFLLATSNVPKAC